VGKKKIIISLLALIFSWFALIGCTSRVIGDGSLHVLVLGVNNEPLAGAKVISNTQPEGQLKVTGITQTDGTVMYNNIKAGAYEFYVSRFDYEQKEFTVTVVAGRTTEVTITLVKTPTGTNP
jgi:uncharacterized lipoprotein NlpE involved in copper resistance